MFSHSSTPLAVRECHESGYGTNRVWDTEAWAKAKRSWCTHALVIKEAVFKMQNQSQDGSSGMHAQSLPGEAPRSTEDHM